jgi:sec-independent protein translocase protein TatA
MNPLVLGLGVPELLIILAVVLLLFGGARLAGIGKSTGRAIKEFKEETKGLKEGDKPTDPAPPPAVGTDATYQQPPATNTTDSAGTDPRRDV